VPLLLLLAACGSDPKDDSGVPTATDTATDSTSTPTASMLATVDGEVTWTVDFGPDSEAAGLTDCAYTRHYTGSADDSAPWLCPACDEVFVVDVEFTAGLDDCYASVSSTAPLEVEYLGYGGGVWYRGSGSWLTERGPAEVDGDTLTVSQEVSPEESGGDYSFAIAGALTLGATEGVSFHGSAATETYACGWPKADPAPYEGDYVGVPGAMLPDGVFHDVCEEPVRLHDFAGSWLVVDISAMDCPPCQDAAETEEAFVEEMAAAGIPVKVITLLAPSLSDSAGTPTQRELQDWIDSFGLTSPVLADRVWGLSVVGQQIPDDFGYPTMVVVDPQLTIVDVQVGFGSWTEFAELIQGAAE